MADVVCIASWNADLVSRVPQPLARGETVMARGFTISPGGKGSNASVACARQGARVAVVARIGDDDFGRMALALWQREGIDIGAVDIARGESSGVAQILVYDDGDNSIAVAVGAGGGLGEAHVQAARSRIESAQVVMASNEVPLVARLAAFRMARAAGGRTVLNPAPAQELPDELLALCDVVTPNEGELRALARLDAQAPIDLAARQVLARGVGAVVVTLGPAGCACFRRGHARIGLPRHDVPVADTIGAGDTFTGALVAALARGDSVEGALRWANAAAALSVTGEGAVGAMPDRDTTLSMLAEAPLPSVGIELP